MSTRRLAILLTLLCGVTLPAAEPPRIDARGDPLPEGARARLGTARWRVPVYARGVALTPDAKVIITYDAGLGTILRMDAATGRLGEPLPGGTRTGAEALLLSRDGHTLVCCGYDGVWVMDMTGAKPVNRITVNRSGMESYSLADGGRFLATASRLYSGGNQSSK